jgi:hypothetical protein
MLGPLLYAGIVCFGITMLFMIRAPEIGWASAFVFLPFAVLAVHTLTRCECYGDNDGIARHLADFPYNRASFESRQLPMADPQFPSRDREYASRS